MTALCGVRDVVRLTTFHNPPQERGPIQGVVSAELPGQAAESQAGCSVALEPFQAAAASGRPT